MSNFKLYIKHNKDLIPLTIYNTDDNGTLFAATYDESIKFQTNNYFELTFKLAYYINKPSYVITKDNEATSQTVLNNNKIENPFVKTLQSGTVLRLVDKNGDVWDAIITSLKYNFHPDNIIIEYTASDIFAYQMSRRAMGYTITNDDTTTIGALPLDSWAIKIKEDCGINWTYNLVDSLNVELIRLLAAKENKTSDEESFNDIKSFDCSGSSAYDALKKLGETYGMQLKLNYEQQSFGFIPTKNPINRGFYLTPNVNLKSLDISTDAQSQTTMLNVTGPTDSLGNEISILGVTPPVFLAWFGGSPAAYHNNNTYWKETAYYSFSAGETVNAATLSDLGFVDKDFDNSSTNDKTCTKNHTFNFSCNLYSDFLEKYYWDNYWAKQEGAKPANFIYDTVSIFSMPITETEREFLNTIKAVPYLENKLIDISYFKDTSILTPAEYTEWYRIVYNVLRIANGQLQYATNTKLKHDSRRNKIIDSCITGMDGLVGEMDAAIVSYIEKKTTNAKNEPVISFASDFKDVYNSVFDENETELGNVSDLVKQYEANWDHNNQLFLKNIYDFEQYFETPYDNSISLQVLNMCSETPLNAHKDLYRGRFEMPWDVISGENVRTFTFTFNSVTSDDKDEQSSGVKNNTFDSVKINYLADGIKDLNGTTSSLFELVIADATNTYSVDLTPTEYTTDDDLIEEIFPLSGTFIQDKNTISLTFKVKDSIKDTISSTKYLYVKQVTLIGKDTKTAENNGNYYIQSLNDTNYVSVVKCADICANLDGFWDNAVKVGLLAGYWLPKSWHYIFTLSNIDKTLYREIKFCPLVATNGSYKINNAFLPRVVKLNSDLFLQSKENTESKSVNISNGFAYNTGSANFCKLTWTYDTYNNLEKNANWYKFASLSAEDLTNISIPSLLIPKYSGIDYPSSTPTNNDLQWFYQPLIGFNETRYLAAREKEDGTLEYYNTDKKEFMRCSFRGILNEYYHFTNYPDDRTDSYNWFTDESTSGGYNYRYLDGESPALYNIVLTWAKKQHYNNAYILAKEKVQEIWKSIYTNYDNLLIENTYENNSALTPTLLLAAAKQKFQELREPEPNYNVSMLDVYNDDLQLNGKLIISDQIGLSLSETDFVVGDNRSYTDIVNGEENSFNKLKQLILKTLFVTEISYSLRQDQAVTITVNPVRYSDVLIDRLVKLL